MSLNNTAMKESDALKLLGRVQLNTGGHKSCTYFAEDEQGKIWFVKGPFKTEEPVKNAQTVADYKRERGIPFLQVKLQYWIPDRWPSKEEVPLGVRNSVDRTIPQPFMMTECLVEKSKLSFIKKSSKVWRETDVVEVNDQMNFDLLSLALSEGGGEDSNKQIWVDYLNALGVRLVLGVNDWADRNFIYNREGNRLISVDEDVLGKEISQTVLVKSKYDKVKTALKAYHADVHRDVIQALVKYFKVQLPVEVRSEQGTEEVQGKKESGKRGVENDEVKETKLEQEAGKKPKRGKTSK